MHTQALNRYNIKHIGFMQWTAISVVILFLTLSCESRNDSHSNDEPGKQNYRSLLKSVAVNKTDSIYEGYYAVPENRQVADSRKLNIYVAVMPSLSRDSIRSPLFYFQGGPGVGAADMVDYFLANKEYRQYRDIVLIDIRGTGKSDPLHCPETQVRTTPQDCMNEMFPIDSVIKCYEQLSRGRDLTQYTTEIAITDVEEIRKWLGYGAVNVMGQSYGTRSCQSYMRQYPEAVRSSVLWCPVPTFLKMPLYHSYDGQAAWDLLVKNCANDSACSKRYPSLSSEFNALMQRLRTKPDKYLYYDSLTKRSDQITITAGPFADLIRSIMYSPKGQTDVPYLIHEAYAGNYAPLIRIAIDRNADPLSLADGFYLCVTCSEDVPFINTPMIGEVTGNTYMGAYRIDQQISACSAWRVNPVNKKFLDPVASSIPALVLAGPQDPITPSRWADSVARQMPNAQKIIISTMAHGIRGLSNPACFHRMVNDFLNSPHLAVNSDCIVTMKSGGYK